MENVILYLQSFIYTDEITFLSNKSKFYFDFYKNDKYSKQNVID